MKCDPETFFQAKKRHDRDLKINIELSVEDYLNRIYTIIESGTDDQIKEARDVVAYEYLAAKKINMAEVELFRHQCDFVLGKRDELRKRASIELAGIIHGTLSMH